MTHTHLRLLGFLQDQADTEDSIQDDLLREEVLADHHSVAALLTEADAHLEDGEGSEGEASAEADLHSADPAVAGSEEEADSVAAEDGQEEEILTW